MAGSGYFGGCVLTVLYWSTLVHYSTLLWEEIFPCRSPSQSPSPSPRPFLFARAPLGLGAVVGGLLGSKRSSPLLASRI